LAQAILAQVFKLDPSFHKEIERRLLLR